MVMQNKSRQMALMGMFSAIILLLAFTPIGFIQLPFIKATIIHIPVIIGSILLGYKYGAVLGFLFGLTSLINNTMAPTLSSFAFSPFIPIPANDSGSPFALIVCFVPRILVGVFPYLVYIGLKNLLKNKMEILCLTISGVVGSLTNTLLVMHLIYFLFRDSYAEVRNIAFDAVYGVILSIIAVNGIPEAIVAGIFTTAVCVPLIYLQKKQAKE
jgi:uncharacterized membrane protein